MQLQASRLRCFLTVSLFWLAISVGFAQYPRVYTDHMKAKADVSPLSRVYLSPQRIVWTSSDSLVSNPAVLLEKGTGQAFFENRTVCKLTNKGKAISGLILDFGKEIHGGLQLTTSQSNAVTRRVRIRFGESVSETCSDAKGVGNDDQGGGATNHHAMRDFEVTLPGYGTLEIGNSGFRFVRIDLVQPAVSLSLQEIRAVATFRNLPHVGSFKCNDERLNTIWETGAYTVHLNMQEYLLDGIKRDRMVWTGDMHPEMMAISSVFGYNEVVPKSLDYVRDHAPLPKFMNGIPSYSMWWVLLQHDWYQLHGRLDYLQQQRPYLTALLEVLTKYVDAQGHEQLNGVGMRFLDWPSSPDQQAVHAGLQALFVLTFEKGATLCALVGEKEKAAKYRALAATMKQYVPDAHQSKQAAALLSLAGMLEAQHADREIIAVGGPKHFSAFFGYYMLQAQAKAGNYTGALDNIRKFWGGMLDLGATTFWEEFDLDEAANAAPIDELVPTGKKDYHRTTGAYCYIGLRRSLCHGWSAGPTPWLSEHVLGIQVLAPGCRKIRIAPHLGDLHWVEGTFPTPLGAIYVKHTQSADGKIKSVIRVPKGVKVVK